MPRYLLDKKDGISYLLADINLTKMVQRKSIQKYFQLLLAIKDSEHTEKIEQISQDVNHILENQASIYEILGEHEVTIRTLRRKIV